MNQSAIKKMGEDGGMNEEELDHVDPSSMNLMAEATIEKNVLFEDYDNISEYSEWRDEMNIFQAFR